LASPPELPSINLVVSRPIADFALREPLLAWLKAREHEMAELLAELIAIPTENPPGRKYRSCTDLLKKRLRQAGLECERHEFPSPPATAMTQIPSQNDPIEKRPASLLATYGRGDRTLYFHGHYDVVPAQSADQFQPIRKEHFLFGRGSCDMKGGIVAMLYAVRALQECAVHVNGKIALTLVPDEETGGARGSAWLAAQGLLGRNGVGMLLPEPTSGVIWNSNRGAISLRVKVLGKSAHVGLQHQGENAFERMLRVVEQLQKLKAEVEQRRTSCTIGAEQSRHSILMLGGQSGSGANFNVVPEQCWFTVDRRINPEENLQDEKARLLAVLERCKSSGIPLEWELLQEGHSSHYKESERLGLALRQSVDAVTGQPPKFEMCPGLLEIRFYAAQGIPAYAYGPGLLSVAHGPNEYVDLRKVCDCAAIYALTAIQMLSS
jgi:acetylornithine deacetylase/succinyl-diaminopimelate desuccinylase family protein